MQVPIQITLRDGIPHSAAVESHIHEKAKKLEHFFQHIIDCRVVVELTNQSHHQGNFHNTTITLAVPGKTLVSKRNEVKNLFGSIDVAFDDLSHQLENYADHLQGETKNHHTLLLGKIIRLFQEENFGFIEGEC